MTNEHAVLLRHGTVHSPVDPFATAMLVVGDEVAWVGSEGAAQAHLDAADEVIDLEGALVTPAFVDAHVHLTETGLAQTGVDLTQIKSLEQCLAAVADWAAANPGLSVHGHGWDEREWSAGRPPTGAELARASGGASVYLSRVDVHSAVITPDLQRDVQAQSAQAASFAGWSEHGQVSQQAHAAVRVFVRGTLTTAQREFYQRAALATAASLGIAAVHENAAPHIGGLADLVALHDLLDQELIRPEVALYWGEAASPRKATELRVQGLGGDLCIDGSLGSHTAHLRQRYQDDPGVGVSYLSQAEVNDHLLACTEVGVQAGFHCIGDEAVNMAIRGLLHAEAHTSTEAVVAARHRFEHLECLDVDHIPILARLGAVASVQPMFDELWGGESGMYAQRLGVERALAMNPLAALARAGVAVALGSDSPVTSMGGWAGVRAAAWHHTPPSQMTVRAAFTAHTRGGWRAARIDDAGVLAPGTRASYAVWDVHEDALVVQAPDERVAAWSTDPRSGVPGLPALGPDIPLPECLRTVAAGRVIFQRS